MKALGLFAVFVLAKCFVLFDREIEWSGWTPLAYLWQDALVALVFGILEFRLRRWPRVVTAAFGLLVVYVAINVPLTREMSSPLTWQMSRAASGTLADSIRHYLTWWNSSLMFLIVVAGGTFGWAWRNPSGWSKPLALAGAAWIGCGILAAARMDCGGYHRNAVAAFVLSAWPRVPATRDERDWRVSPFESGMQENHVHLEGAAAGRNVVMIVLESTGARYLRTYGASADPMPNLTRLAGSSIVVENAYSVYPESIKGLFAVLCSRYPAFDTGPKAFERVSTPSLAQILRDQGYHTGLFHSGRFMYLGMRSVVQGRGFHRLEDAGDIGGNVNSSFGVDEPSTVRRMLQWIDSLPSGQPFFLTYLPIAGHHPYEAPGPGPFPGTDDSSQYLNALHYSDAALGELLQGLQSRGRMTNTLFVVLGDHGEAFGQHEGNYGHTLFLYEENIRVPLLFAVPGLIGESLRLERLASVMDVVPTVLELLGLRPEADHQGRSLLKARGGMALFYTDYSLPLVGLRDGPWKFIHEIGSRHSRLFNLVEDPDERSNLAAALPERVEAYRAHLLRWSSAQKGRLSEGGRANVAMSPKRGSGP